MFTPEVSIRVMGEYHGIEGLPFLPDFQRQARVFFFLRNTSGEAASKNVVIAESYARTEEERLGLLALSSRYSPLETFVRTPFLRVASSMSPDEIDYKVATRVFTRKHSPEYLFDYYTQQLICLDELRASTDFLLDSEYHSPKEIEEIEVTKARIIKNIDDSGMAFYFGETDLAVAKYTSLLQDESHLTRGRHRSMVELVGSYIQDSRQFGIPTRILVHFGNGHVKGLVKALEKAFGDLEPKPNISGSYLSDGFYSYHYDLVSEMEIDPERSLTKREVINILLQNVFEGSPIVSSHTLKRSMSPEEFSAVIYHKIGSRSDAQIDEIIEVIKKRGFEQGLVQLTGMGGDIPFPGVSERILRRIRNFIALRR